MFDFIKYAQIINLGGSIMPRVTLKEQPSYEFHYPMKVQVRDLNYAGHLGNDVLIGILQDARANLLNDLGCKELDLGDGKTGIIIGDLAINFKSEGFLFDELQVDSHIDEFTEKSFRIYYRIINVKNNSIIALAETGLIAFDYNTREVTKVPEILKRTLDQYIQTQEK